MKASEKQKILFNILARGGNIDDIDLSTELAKSMALLNRADSMGQMTQMQNPVPMTTPEAVGQPIPPAVEQNTGQPPQSPQINQNEGQGALNLP
jgi:hypothetical protein